MNCEAGGFVNSAVTVLFTKLLAPYYAIHKAARLSAAIQNGLWGSFLLAAPIQTNGTFFSGMVEW